MDRTDDGYFFLEREGGPCDTSKNNDKLTPNIVINPGDECEIRILTSCNSEPYIGQTYTAIGPTCDRTVTFKQVGYCIKVRGIDAVSTMYHEYYEAIFHYVRNRQKANMFLSISVLISIDWK